MNVKIYNPVFVYISMWGVSLFLYSYAFTNNLLGIDSATYSLIMTSILSFITLYVIVSVFMCSLSNISGLNRLENISEIRLGFFKKIMKKMLNFWCLFTFIEILLFKGVPFVSVVIQGNYAMDYTRFGIPTVHGLLNALYFTVTTGYFLHYKLTREKNSRTKVLTLLIWPLLVMSRATLLWALVQILCIHLIFTKVTLKRLFVISILMVFFVISFGIVGDNRSENNGVRFTDSFVSERHASLAQNLPTGFVWVYLYATTPINNLVYNSSIEPTYDFSHSFRSLIPSFVRDKIFDSDNRALSLYQEGFNVSSYFANYLGDFGHIGANIFVGILQLVVVVIYFMMKTMKIGSILAYTAIFYAVLTSVFFDNFMSLVTITQVALGFLLNNYLYR